MRIVINVFNSNSNIHYLRPPGVHPAFSTGGLQYRPFQDGPPPLPVFGCQLLHLKTAASEKYSKPFKYKVIPLILPGLAFGLGLCLFAVE